MGWHRSIGKQAAAFALASIGLALPSISARAQEYVTLAGPYLTLSVGNTAAVGGSISLTVNGSTPVRPILLPGEIRPAGNNVDRGSHIYIRIDGGSQSTQ